MGLTPGRPINPNYPSGYSQGGLPPADPNLMKKYRTVMEAMDAYYNDQMRGGNLPLSSYLQNVQQPGDYPGAQPPYGTKSTFDGTRTGETTTTGETSRELPEDVRERYKGLVDRLLGQGEFGYSPEEQAGMQVGPEELEMLLRKSGLPVAGAANAARDELMRRYASRGGAGAGVNATLERIQQEQGRQAGEAAQGTQLGVLAANREAAIAAANARLGEKSDVSRQAGGLLTGWPEFTGKTDTTSASDETTKSTATTLPTSPKGGVAGGAIGGGSAGVMPKAPAATPPPPPSATNPPTTLFGMKKKKPAGGLIPMLP